MLVLRRKRTVSNSGTDLAFSEITHMGLLYSVELLRKAPFALGKKLFVAVHAKAL